ncbi:P-loop containing nucleoside triphosphate hydrolase protein [Biscogniauxia marginata]|nr:P-loop containing nucleoside triphosphate hydrolase protein [Biscogniauxia marginata]
MDSTTTKSQASGIQRDLDTIKRHVNYEPVSVPGQGWRAYPEIPTAHDLNPDWNDPAQRAEMSYLLPNTWQRPWSDKNTYLETHYRLQREEAVTMLRYSIQKFRVCPLMMDDDETCIYTKVFVKGYLMTRLGPFCRVQFSTERCGKRIRWSQTRRLTTGSLVVLSTAEDGFKTICMPAIIADHPIRDGLDQNPPTIQLHWAKMDDAIMDPTIELVMIESRFGYFEAVRHCLVGLQQVATTDTPLDKYLVEADKSDHPAQYVEKNPRMNISSLIHHVPSSGLMTKAQVQQQLAQVRQPLTNCSVIDGISDRLSPFTNLDNSQLGAVHRILTKELAIIQGPPGTGKTFTSVQALQILLNSQQRGSNVVIVAAQTNHAVDQILIQLINLGFNAVRLGGRTQNEEIKRYSMYNLRRRAMPRLSLSHGADRDYRTFEAARKKNISTLERIVSEIFPEHLIDPQTLHAAGIISEKQLDSLLSDEWDSAVTPGRPDGIFSEWLGDQLLNVPPMNFKDPVFDEPENDDTIDLDDEDYNMELDDCIADDDENRGRVEGKWVPISHRWTGLNPYKYTENDLVVRRELKKQNLWDIEAKHRGAVYQYWQRQLLRVRDQEFRNALADNARICKNLKINRWYKDTQCIKAAQIDIIGCTTTGLCKYRGLLSALRPRTMLIEEAAETREANIMSALYSSLQQLILVGDHQQLAPHCDITALGEDPYFLRVSMFERLVKLKMPISVLNMQRRMTPTLRELLNPFYPTLKDHPVVTKEGARPAIPGMKFESFFFHHTWMEGTDENMSKYNILEAEMIVHFVDYLLMNGVDPAKITILTFYRGQRKKIMSEMRKKLTYRALTNVHTVDSYQGEENDIILLSLVRSNGPNGPHKAGFLRDENRGVVSISRARRGFYIFGNMINLANAGPGSWDMWGQVEKVFKRQNRYGGDSRLPITCQQHGNTSWIAHPEDWVNHHGGCTLPCLERLSCGHPCGRRCHWVDHSRLICQQPCERVLPCGHRCQEVCGEKCLCTCHAFTGAYPHDEGWDEDNSPDGQVDSLKHRVNSTGSSRRRRPNGRGGRYGLRGRRGGTSYTDNHNPAVRERNNCSGGMQLESARSFGWSNFNAQRDDVERKEAKQRTSQQGKDLTGPSTSPPLSENPAEIGNPILETYRPVTLSHRGKRNVGDGIVSGSSGTPSPEKPELKLVCGSTPLFQRQMPRIDLLGFEDVNKTQDSIYPSKKVDSSVHSYESTKSLNNLDPLDEELIASTPPRSLHERYEAAPVMGFRLDGSHYSANTRGMTLPVASQSHPNPRLQVDNPEWEIASTVDGRNDGNGEIHGNKEDDLIKF